MKLISRCIALFIFVLLITSCKKDDPVGLSSAEGKWTYSTPDGKMNIDFEMVKSDVGLKIQNAKLKVDGTTAETVVIPDEVTSPAFSSLRFSANDPKLVYGYYLLFTGATISNDFTKIEVAAAEYTFPWGTTKKLSDIVIVRP